MYQYPYYPNSQQIVHVNGQNGAQMYQMTPNSSCLLLDENEAKIYLAQTDGAGYKTITAYNLVPYKPEPEPDFKSLEERIARIEKEFAKNESYTTKNNNQEQYTTER